MERYKEKSRFPLNYLILAVCINAAILYIIFNISILQYVSAAALVGFLLLVVYQRRNKTEYQIGKRFSPSFGDYRLFVRNYFRLTSKFFITSSIGLIIALLLIGQSTIMINSYQQYAFDNYIEGSDTAAFKFEGYNMIQPDIVDWEGYFSEQVDDWVELENFEMTSEVTYGTIHIDMMLGEGTSTSSQYVDTHYIVTRQWTQYHYDLLTQLPTFPDDPFDPDESWLILPSSLNFPTPEFGFIKYDPSDYVSEEDGKYYFDILVDQGLKYFQDEELPITFNNVTFEADNFWKWSQQDIVYLKENELLFPNNLLFGSYFVPDDKEWDLLESLEIATEGFNETHFIWGYIGFESYITINIPLIEEIPLDIYLDRLLDVKDIIIEESYAYIRQFHSYNQFSPLQKSIISPLESLLDDYLRYETHLTSLMQITSIPLIFISLYLFYFARSLVEKRKEEIFTKFKQRGATTGQLQLLVSLEVIGYTIVSSILALVLSIGITRYLLQETRLLNDEVTGIDTLVPSDLYWSLPVLAFLFSLNFSLKNLRDLELLEIGGNNFSIQEESFLEKGNYDVIMFILAGIYWGFIPFLVFPRNAHQFIYSYMGYLAIIFTLISVPLIAKRYVLKFVEIFLNKLPSGKDTSFLAIKGIRRNSNFTSKFVAIFLLTILFTYMGMISSNTIIDVNESMSRYNIGADGLVTGIGHIDNEDWAKVKVENVNNYTMISRVFYFPNSVEIPPGSTAANMVKYDIMGINLTDFEEAAFWRDDFADTDLSVIVEQLKGNQTVAMHSNVIDNLDLELGNEYIYYFGYQSRSQGKMNVTASFDLFPLLLTEIPRANRPSSSVKTIQLVTSLENAEYFADQFSRVPQYAALVDFVEGADPEEIRHEIINTLIYEESLRVLTYESNRVSLFEANNAQIAESPLAIYEELYLLASMSILLVVSFITAICALLYYGFYMINMRKHEVGIYRAFGMVNSQIQRVLLLEVVILVLISLFTGVLAGTGLSLVIYSVISGQPVRTVPPLRISVPYLLAFGYGFLIIVISSLIAFRTTKNMANREVRSILRAE